MTGRTGADRLVEAARDAPAGRVLETVVPVLREVLGADVAVAYALAPTEAGLDVEDVWAAGSSAGALRQMFRSVLRPGPRGWDGILYDPLRPEPDQRNQVRLHHDGDGSRDALERYFARIPRTAAAFAENGLLRDQVRVLLCDGPLLLAWLGAFRDVPFTEQEAGVLVEAIAPVRARLVAEQHLGADGLAAGAIDALLESVPRAAFLLRAPGRVLLANAAGRVLLERDAAGTLERLCATVRGQGGPAAGAATSPGRPGSRSTGAMPAPYQLTPIRAAGMPECWLAVARADPGDPGPALESFARAHGLTPRQTEVLGMLVRGTANKVIAADLGCAMGTVELHVTALLRKTGTGNRAELVARFWAGGW